MTRLAVRRPVFCSEADFQHELALEIRTIDARLKVRLEWPLASTIRGAIDLIVIGEERCALELKYLCKKFETTLDGEQITLRHHGAPDQRRYDVCKDLRRIEEYVTMPGCSGGVLVLTNDPCYWKPSSRNDNVDAAFHLNESKALTGCLMWNERAQPGTIKRRESSLDIKGTYLLKWRDYCELPGPAGLFRYLWIPVGSGRVLL